jgi:hypothetical protein
MVCDEQWRIDRYLQILQWRDEDIAEADNLHRIIALSITKEKNAQKTYILMLDVLEELELSICAFTEHRSTERLHDLLDGDR